MNPTSRKLSGFTIVELCVAIVIVLILLSIFIPYLASVRETSRRAACANQLHQIFAGLKAYANVKDNHQAYPHVVYDPAVRPDGFVVFTGVQDDDPFKPGGVEPSDVTASLFLLVRLKLLESKVFVCPSSSADVDVIGDHLNRGNFKGPGYLSYSYAMPFSSSPEYRFNADRLRAEFVLVSDRNPGIGDGSDVTVPGRNAPPLDLARANSRNHRRTGQNVLYATGSVSFWPTPYCGYENDNIFTAQASRASTQPLNVPEDTNGVFSDKIGPARPYDSYLVP